MLRCPNINGVRYLMASLQEPCFTGRHSTYVMLLTIPQIIIYILGLPIVGTIHLMRNKDQLHERHFYTRYGLLYLGYRDDRAWWELVVAFRKVAVVAIGTFGTFLGVVDIQAHLVLLVVFVSIVIHLIGEPFDTTKKNTLFLHRLELMALSICWLTFWGGLLFFLGHEKSGSVSPEVKILMTFGLVGTNVVFLLVSFGIFVKEYRKDKKTQEKRQTATQIVPVTNGSSATVVPIDGNANEEDVRFTPEITRAQTNSNEDVRFTPEITRDKKNSLSHTRSTVAKADALHDDHIRHERALNKSNDQRSKHAKRKTQLRLIERSKIKSLKTLKKVPGFSNMNDSQISKLVDTMKLLKFNPNEIICQEGDDATTFYVILEGNCSITSLRHGTRKMATIGEMDFFGESMMTTNVAFRTRTATVTVVPVEEENEDMKKKSRHGVQVLALERSQYDLLRSNNEINLSDTNKGIEVIAKQRKQENRQNLVAGKAMNRLKSMRKSMKTKDTDNNETKKLTAAEKELKKSDFGFGNL